MGGFFINSFISTNWTFLEPLARLADPRYGDARI
jgi:hypothetical protein